MKRFLRIAATVVAVGAVAIWLWPSAPPAPPARAPAPAATLPSEHVTEQTPPPAQEEKNRIRVAFVNHLGDADITFAVDGVRICTAPAGRSCFGDVRYGKHVIEGLEKGKVVRTLELTLDRRTANPRVIVCFPTSPTC